MMKAYPYLSINMDKPSYVGGYYSQTGKTIKDSVHIEFPESIGKSAIIQKTSTAFDNIEKSGIIYHIPFSLGLELGRNNNVDLGFAYYFQPSVKQYVGSFAVGITFPLNN